MPFGLKNLPSVFMRFVDQIFKDLIRQEKILIYMDDILDATETLDQYFGILSEVFALMTANLLELSIDECSFLQEKVNYSRYSIDKHGIEPNLKIYKV